MRNAIAFFTTAAFIVGFSTCGNKQKEEEKDRVRNVVTSDEQAETKTDDDYPEINMKCSGTEPFWGAEVTNEKVVLEDHLGETTGYEVKSRKAPDGRLMGWVDVFELENKDGKKAQLIIRNAFEEGCACSDGMSDIEYSAHVLLISEDYILEGCAEEKE